MNAFLINNKTDEYYYYSGKDNFEIKDDKTTYRKCCNYDKYSKFDKIKNSKCHKYSY